LKPKNGNQKMKKVKRKRNRIGFEREQKKETK